MITNPFDPTFVAPFASHSNTEPWEDNNIRP